MPRTRRAKSAKSKGSGEKYITERRDGRFGVTVPAAVFDADTGRHKPYQNTFPSLDAARAARDRVLNDRHRGIVIVRDSTIVRELLKQWGERRRAAGVEYSTALNHAWLTELVCSEIGDIQVVRLLERDVDRLIARLRERRVHDRTLAPSTVAKAYRHLRAALDEAFLRGAIPRNVAKGVTPPKMPTRAVRDTWTPKELDRLWAAIRESRQSTLFVVLLVCGARIGELVGARNVDFDPATGQLHLAGTAKKGGGRGRPKSEAGDRELPLPPEVCRLLKAHLAEVARARAAAGSLWGSKQATSVATRGRQRDAAVRRYAPGWAPEPPTRPAYTPLFPSGNGTPLLVRNMQREWTKILQRAQLNHRPLHETRAAWTTAVLEELPIHEVQQAVGHASPAMTMGYARRVSGRKTLAPTIAAERLGLTAFLKLEKEDVDEDENEAS